jgi:hypothetical protein
MEFPQNKSILMYYDIFTHRARGLNDYILDSYSGNPSITLLSAEDPVSETSCFLVSRIPDDEKGPKPQYTIVRTLQNLPVYSITPYLNDLLIISPYCFLVYQVKRFCELYCRFIKIYLRRATAKNLYDVSPSRAQPVLTFFI